MRLRRWGLIRSADAAVYLQVFVVSGVSTVLLTRAYLEATGYPKIAGGSLHIAHVLWGGLLLMVGLGVALAFLDPRAKLWAAVLGGAGFGLFIDEIGKFVTEKKDYFYRPAAGAIYITFALLVVLVRWVRERSELAPEERTANAIYALLVGTAGGLTGTQRASAEQLLAGSDRDIDATVLRLLATTPHREPAVPAIARDAWARVRGFLDQLATRRWLVTVVVVYLVAEPLLTLFGVLMDVTTGAMVGEREWGAITVVIACAVVTATIGGWGTLRLRRDRLKGLRLLYAALLTHLLIGQVFAFTINQFAAVSALAVDLIVLWILSTALRAASGLPSRRSGAEASRAVSPPSPPADHMA